MARKTGTERGARAPLEHPYTSKITLPIRRSAIVHRQRLIDALRDAVARRITVVTAPAGYGKTTLLFDFAQQWGQPVCWYGLDERDRDLTTFLRYYLASCERQFPGFGAELAQAVSSGGTLNAERCVDLMVAAVEAQPQPFVFVLDDFHFLDDGSPELREVLEGWLYRLPPQCHVVLSGRTQPQLSILPLMAARQEVETLTAAEFSFRCEEVAQLCLEALGKSISLDDAQHLANLTEGWAGALVLLLGKTQDDYRTISLEQLKGSDTLFRYIELEQFQPLPQDVKEFLTGSAILRSLDEKVVGQLLGITDVEEKFYFLEQRNLFIVRQEQEAFRYHRLFRAFLVSYLRARDPQRFTELNLKAAQLMEQAKEWEEAVYHYIQAAAWDKVVSVTERVGWRLFEEGRWDTLADWLEAVPAEELTAQPKLILWKARILYYLNQLDRALALLSQSTASLEAKEDWEALANALVTKGMCLRVKGQYQESKQALVRARGLLLKDHAPASAVAEARKELGITLARCGELTEAVEELRSLVQIYEVEGDMYNLAYTSDELGGTLNDVGRLAEASTFLERARTLWLKLGNRKHLLQTLNNLAFSYYLSGDYERSERVVREALERARLDSPRAEAYLLSLLADIRRDKGECEEALEMYAACLEMGRRVDDAYIRVYTMNAIANTRRFLGDIVGAQTWIQRAIADAEKSGGAMEKMISLMTAGVLKRDRQELKEALKDFEQAISYLEQVNAKREMALLHFHIAWTYFSLKRKSLSLDYLEKAAQIVVDLGYDHFLQVEAARNPLLIQYAAANKIADGYYERLLKQIRPMRTATAPAPTVKEQPEAEADSATLRAYALGNPRVEIGGREITDLEWRSEKGKEMFFFFLCNQRPLRKDEIVTALWPDLPEDKTTSAFHSNMYRLRKALYAEVIAKDSGRYVLDPRGGFSFDVEQFQELLKQADAAPKGGPEAIALMEKAVALYGGPFAPDFYSEWAQTLRWQLEEHYMSLLGALAAAYSQAREYKRSADVCQRILDLDEYNEAAWYRLMACYIHSGQMEAAKYCYNRYTQLLASGELEDEARDFDQLYREIVEAG